ncbi:NAD-dependent glycerol-3-phosphate dehydrogenase [Spraguea lophii 42_110]|uniref:Glycerol-3-phosphate dehydrogenase [NAD(+)] n=1 Tax=Spraguea lophii (strain 42_110) TaxID=1358809 RepID=S7W919_SPRLO|nr:NAD-dependent glycerol-3-phosphate dehydrogenase [Spraguea lophii 42_110]
MLNISIIGSGNFGTCIGRLIAKNIKDNNKFNDEIKMWTYEEMVEGKKLTEIINEKNENVKYLPGVKLPNNLKAIPEIKDVVENADILIFILPHQFVERSCQEIKKYIKNKNVIGITLTKGILYKNGLIFISDYLKDNLGIDISVLMGANIAKEIANDAISEATIGYNIKKNGYLLKEIFNSNYFKISITDDLKTVELSGTIKNITAIGYGIALGLNAPTNTTVAIFRRGLIEQHKIITEIHPTTKIETLFESAGIADLLVTCLSGRNSASGKKIAEGMGLEEIEKSMGGQQLQGPGTAEEIYHFIKSKGIEREYPFFVSIYKICFKNASPNCIFDCITKY